MIGVDEAGKGAVVGSMFVAAVACDGALPDGVRDSKHVSPDEREHLARRIRETCAVAVVEVTADEVDSYVSDGGMNDLMVEAHSRALRRLGVSGRAVHDASDTNADRFARRVAERAPDGVEVDAEHGADESHPIVGAASIVAKVERDAHVARHDAGSGYPSDDRTVAFLCRHAPDYPACVRESWTTARRVEREEKQTDFGDFSPSS